MVSLEEKTGAVVPDIERFGPFTVFLSVIESDHIVKQTNADARSNA